MLNRNNLGFYSPDTIDKIVQSGEITIVNDGVRPEPLEAKLVTTTASNNYGRASLIRAIWTVDDGAIWRGQMTVEFNAFEADVYNGSTFLETIPFLGVGSAIGIGCSDSLIHIRAINGYTQSGVELDVEPEPVQWSFSPVSLTFRIQYWMFERE